MWMPGPADLREVSLGDMSVGYILDEMYESESREKEDTFEMWRRSLGPPLRAVPAVTWQV